MRPPLRGLRVLDLTRVLAGPFATMLLADLGADVVKVEHPEGDDTRRIPPQLKGESHYFLSVNRNKRGIVVDLKQPAGRDLLLELARRCDALVENFRPGVAERLGIDHASVRAGNPEIVYCSLSAFGQSGPLAGRGAFDAVLQAAAGWMSLTGETDGPPLRSGLPLADLASGLFAALAVVAALLERHRGGRGQLLDVSMFDVSAGLLTQWAARYFMTGEVGQRHGSGHPGVAPYGSYVAADGEIVIANWGERFWPRIAAAVGRPELAEDERFLTNALRVEHREELDRLLNVEIGRRSVGEWEAIFERHDIPHAPVLSVAEVLEHPQTEARGLVAEVEHPLLGRQRTLGPTLRFEGQPLRPAPLLGQHTDEVLVDLLGIPARRLRELRAAGVIA